MVAPFLYRSNMDRYVRKRKGKFIASDVTNIFSRRTQTQYLKYSDKHNNIRAVTLNYFGPFSFFGEDEIIEYDHSSPEYKELKAKETAKEQEEIKKQLEFSKRAESFEEESYTLENHDLLTIKQEYAQPNIGERVFINSNPAPDGKYKIGFMSFIYVENGKITAIEMD